MNDLTSSSSPRRLLAALLAAGALASCAHDKPEDPSAQPPADASGALKPGKPTKPRLVGRAVLEAATFAPGPTSGQFIGPSPQNGIPVPFVDQQPVQGFSGVLDNGDGTFWATLDNGYGALENSADSNLRVYLIRPDFKTRSGGTGRIDVEGFIELRDPDRKLPFAVTNFFTEERVLTGADIDVESMQRAPDGTFWFGDEFGPFLLHTDATGKVLEAPIVLPDFEQGGELRAPQSPLVEEASAVRVMNAVRAHARRHGNLKTPVFSPWFSMLNDRNAATSVPSRAAPPAGSGLEPASSEVFDVGSLQRAGYPVVTWTVNDLPTLKALLGLGVNGIISDRPDLLLQAVREHDANRDGTSGDFLTEDGLIDVRRFDAQGHRGGRNLRPENTLPAMEVALDHLMTTLELDTGISADGVPMLDHDPYVEAAKCRRLDGRPYERAQQVLVRSLTAAQLQSTFVCDRIIRAPDQVSERALSPVSVAFAERAGLADPYVIPTLQQVFDLVAFYVEYYRTGPGASHPDAARRAKNAERVRYNIETKLNPRRQYAARTVAPGPFADAVARAILDNGLADRADVQSFDFRTLLHVQEKYPQLRTVYLFGDFPVFADRGPGTDEGTNLQPDEGTDHTPWLGGLPWPYRSTVADKPLRVQGSGGFEGMALSPDGTKLYPLLEKPLVGGEAGTLLIHEFDLAQRRYTGVRHLYRMDVRGQAIGDFILFDEGRGLVIERDNTQGDLNGHKVVYEVRFNGDGQPVHKRMAVDLMRIDDTFRLTAPVEGDVGLGETFAFPFVTIENVVVLDRKTIGVINDNNFPFSIGRHTGPRRPDDTEFIRIELEQELGKL